MRLHISLFVNCIFRRCNCKRVVRKIFGADEKGPEGFRETLKIVWNRLVRVETMMNTAEVTALLYYRNVTVLLD